MNTIYKATRVRIHWNQSITILSSNLIPITISSQSEAIIILSRRVTLSDRIPAGMGYNDAQRLYSF